MNYKLLGNTGLKVSELCIGTMTFGGKGMYQVVGTVPQETANQLIKQSVDAGINFIDTANVYSEGLSEEMTGKAIRSLGLERDKLVIATKVRGKMGDGANDTGLTRKHIMQEVEASLKRLQVDYIDLYQTHALDPLTPIGETLSALGDLVRSGKVRYIGASNVAAWQLMKAQAVSAAARTAHYVSLQVYYSLVSRDVEREIIPLLQDQRLGLLVWSPLAAGFLTGKYGREDDQHVGGRRASFDFPPVNRERLFAILDVLKPMAGQKNRSVAQLALAWLLKQSAVTSVIIGANNADQLTDNLKAVEVTFTDEELGQLDEVSKLPAEYPAWMIEVTNTDRQ